MNVAIEDALAHAADENEREMVLEAWLRLGVEYYARQVGRRGAVDQLMSLRQFVETAQPGREWPK